MSQEGSNNDVAAIRQLLEGLQLAQKTTTVSSNLPKIEKLKEGKDFEKWKTQLRLHFETKELLSTFEEGGEGVKEAVCKRDLLSSVDESLVSIVYKLPTSKEMFESLRNLLVGSPVAIKMKMKQKLTSLRFTGDFQQLFKEFQTILNSLKDYEDKLDWNEVGLVFLNKLPKFLNFLTYSKKRELEVGTVKWEEKEFQEVFKTVLDYSISNGLLQSKVPEKDTIQKTKPKSMNAVDSDKKKKRTNLRCYDCGEIGHTSKECKKGVKCFKCQKFGHKSNECPEHSKNKGADDKPLGLMTTTQGLTEGFLIDGGSTYHVCGCLELFTFTYNVSEMFLETAGEDVKVTKMGKVAFVTKEGKPFKLDDVCYYEGAPNLLSVNRIEKKGYSVLYKNGTCSFMDSAGSVIYKTDVKTRGVYVVPFENTKKQFALVANTVSVPVWHCRFSHCSKKKLEKTIENSVDRNELKDFVSNFNPSNCRGCVFGKSTRKPISKTKSKLTKKGILEALSCDCLDFPRKSVDRKTCALTVCDAGSGYLWFFPMNSKREVFDLLKTLLLKLERLFPGKVKILRSDQGTEFTNKKLTKFLQEQGITQQFSNAHEHELNGRAENSNRMLLAMVRASLQMTRMSQGYWSFAGKAACVSYNMLSFSDEKSPYELVHKTTPPISRLRIFGVHGFVHVDRSQRSKLDRTSEPCRFLGYDVKTNSYLLLIGRKKMITSRTFHCDEELVVQRLLQNQEETPLDDAEDSEDSELLLLDCEKEHNEEHIADDCHHEDNDDEDEDEPQEESQHEDSHSQDDGRNGESVQQRYNLRSSVQVPKRFEEQVKPLRTKENILSCLLKLRVQQAIIMKARKKRRQAAGSYFEIKHDERWLKAYQKELRKLEEIGNLKVVKRTKGMTIIPFSECFEQKRDNINHEDILKVRLAARGDLLETKESTYSPAAHADDVRIFLMMLKMLKCYTLQCDCPGAYLNGRLDEVVHLYLPNGHELKDTRNTRVYECGTSIYGLAVSGKVWYYTFVKLVKKIDLVPSKRNPCLFLLEKENKYLYLLLYVDEFLFGSADYDLCIFVRDFLKKELNIKATGHFESFVGFEIERKENTLFLHQEKLILKALDEYEITTTESLPLPVNFKWTEGSKELVEKKKLQALFGTLNYISCVSRPDIAFSVNMIARRLEVPTLEVFRAGKRILKYLASTLDYGLRMDTKERRDLEVKVFTDATFADCTEDKFKSTGGYLIFVNDVLVSWKSKKLKWVCASVAHSEYLSMYEGSKQALSIAFLIEEVFKICPFPILLRTDNKAVVDTISKMIPNEMIKSMKTKYFAPMQWIEEDLITAEHISTNENPADGMTKVSKAFTTFKDVVLKVRRSVEESHVMETAKQQQGEQEFDKTRQQNY